MPTAVNPKCETCGKSTPTMTVCQDTYFCSFCWADFGTAKWKGIGSRMPKEETPSESEEPEP